MCKVPFSWICSIWVFAKWVPMLWTLSEQSKNFDKNVTQIKVSQIRVSQIRASHIRASQIRASQIRVSQIRVSQIRATEISSSHGELHGAIFVQGFKSVAQTLGWALISLSPSSKSSGQWLWKVHSCLEQSLNFGSMLSLLLGHPEHAQSLLGIWQVPSLCCVGLPYPPRVPYQTKPRSYKLTQTSSS